MCSKRKGFTLIELVISMAILSIAITVIYSFFLADYKAVNKAEIELELQSQGDLIFEKIGKIALQSSEIELTTADKDDIIDKIDDSFQFIVKEPYTFIVKETHIFTLKSDNKLFLDGVEFGQFIEYVTCTKITNGVQIEIKLKKGEVEKSIGTTIYFRNAM